MHNELLIDNPHMIDILRVFRPFLIGLTVVLGFLYFLLCVYFSGSVKGSVFEESTGKPIQGAIVMVSWSMNEIAFWGAIPVRSVHVQETLTDKDGKFSFKPWIDVTRLGYTINSARPEVSVAKHGYLPMVIASTRSSPNDVGRVTENQGNKKLEFFMAPPNGKWARWGYGISGTSTPLMHKYYYEYHGWSK